MNDNKDNLDELFKDYEPETLEYDPEVDGSDEHKIRDDHLDEKAKLLEKFKKNKVDGNTGTTKKRSF